MLAFEWAFFVVLLLFCLLCGTAGVLCAACCVRPGCSVRPPSTAHDLPSSVWSLCVPVGGGPPARRPRRRACLGRPGRCVCRWAAARPRDRHTRACGSEWSISRPALALPPPTGTATMPRHRPRAPQPGPPRPPHLWGRVVVRQLYASSRSPARPRHRPRTPQPGHSPRTRPHKREKMRPARLHERNIAPAGHSTAWLTSSVKEISPLHAQNRQNTAFFSVPGRRIFHGTPQHLTQGRFFFHPSPSPTPRAGQNSPCSASFLSPISIPGFTPPGATPTAQTSRGVRTHHKVGGTLAA